MARAAMLIAHSRPSFFVRELRRALIIQLQRDPLTTKENVVPQAGAKKYYKVEEAGDRNNER
jgi:hypothetical protein